MWNILHMFDSLELTEHIINKPGVAGAILQKTFVIHSLIH